MPRTIRFLFLLFLTGILPCRARAEEYVLQMSLIVEDLSRYEAEFLIRDTDAIPSMLLSDFEEVCSDRVRPEILENLLREIPIESTPDGKKWAKIGSPRQSAYQVEYNASQLEVSIHFSESAKKTRVISVQNQQGTSLSKESTSPSTLSGAITAFATYGIQFQSDAEDTARSLGFGTDFEEFVTYKNMTLQNWNSLKHRTQTRLVTDFSEKNLRALVGDFQARRGSGLSPTPLLGVTVQKEVHSAASLMQVYANGQYYLRLQRRSRVEVLIQSHVIAVFYLEPGFYDFRDFPGTPGFVDAAIRTEDDLGRVTLYDASYYLSPRLMAVVENDLQYFVVIPRSLTHEDEEPQYQFGNTTFGFSHRYGMSGRLTGELGFQGKSDGAVASLGLSWTHKHGLLEGVVNRSRIFRDSEMGFGYSIGETLELNLFGLPTPILGKLDLTRESAQLTRFYGTGESTPLRIRGLLAISPTDSVSTTLSLSQIIDNERTNWIPTLSVRYSSPYRITASLKFSREIVAASQAMENRAELICSWSLPEKSLQGLARVRSKDSSIRTEFSHIPEKTVGATLWRAGLERSEQTHSLDSEMDWVFNRFELGWNQQSSKETEGDHLLSHHQLQLGSSLVFSDFNFGVTRPVGQGFLMVKTGEKLKGKKLMVNRNRNGDCYAQTDILGDPILPNVMPFEEMNVSIDLENDRNQPLLEKKDFSYTPRFQSGGVIFINPGNGIAALGKLLLPDGKPLLWGRGTLTHPDGQNLAFFTDDQGEFFLDSIAPGEWSLTIEGNEYEPCKMTVIEKDEYPLQLGEYHLKSVSPF